MKLSRLEKESLLCDALGLDIEELLAHPELADEENPAYKEMVKRLEKREPLAYVLESQPFLGLEFKVNSTVLIPRPETEEMTEMIINKYKTKKKLLKVADIGTGSGVIAISLAKYLKNAKVVAVDISESSLKTAKENALEHCIDKRIKFVRGDLLKPLGKDTFDLIVSNPPYIPSSVIQTLEPEVKEHEPRQALDGGKDGLSVIKRILKEAPRHLKQDGELYIEIGYDQASRAIKEARKYFDDVTVDKDLCGKERFLKACKPLKSARKA